MRRPEKTPPGLFDDIVLFTGRFLIHFGDSQSGWQLQVDPDHEPEEYKGLWLADVQELRSKYERRRIGDRQWGVLNVDFVGSRVRQ